MEKNKKEDIIARNISGQFLTEAVDNWSELSEDEAMEFIGEHLWEPLEYVDPEIIMTTIQEITDYILTLDPKVNA